MTAPVFGTVVSGETGGNATSTTVSSVTVASDATRYLLLFVGAYNETSTPGSVPAATWDSGGGDETALTEIVNGKLNNLNTCIFGAQVPAGTSDILITHSLGRYHYVAVPCTNVDTTTAYGNANFATISSASADYDVTGFSASADTTVVGMAVIGSDTTVFDADTGTTEFAAETSESTKGSTMVTGYANNSTSLNFVGSVSLPAGGMYGIELYGASAASIIPQVMSNYMRMRNG